jgi:hypothetical protein
MKNWILIACLAFGIAVAGHFTQWFGFTKPAIEAVRAESQAGLARADQKIAQIVTKVDHVDAKVAANTERIALGEAKTAILEQRADTQATHLEAVRGDVRAVTGATQANAAQLAQMSERVEANAQSINELKAKVNSGGTKTAAEMQLERDIIGAIQAAQSLRVAYAEAYMSEGRPPTSNAQVGAPAPDAYADGTLKRLEIDSAGILATFDAPNPNPNPRIRLAVNTQKVDAGLPMKWACTTNIPMAARMMATCELKPSL